MIILPTRGRPSKLKRFIRAYEDMDSSLGVTLIFDNCEKKDYSKIELLEGWSKVKIDRLGGVATIYRQIMRDYGGKLFYGFLGDDMTPETHEWDMKLLKSCMDGFIVWASDGIGDTGQNPFVLGVLAEELLPFLPPVRHFYFDTFWRDLSDDLQIGGLQKDILLKHHHYTAGLSVKDDTYKQRGNSEEDRTIYETYQKEHWDFVLRRAESLILSI